jgi:hypothetical protein
MPDGTRIFFRLTRFGMAWTLRHRSASLRSQETSAQLVEHGSRWELRLDTCWRALFGAAGLLAAPPRYGSMTIEEQASSVGKLRLVGQGAEAEVFEWRDGRVLKLLRARGATERLACEVAALEAAYSAGVRVPRAYEQVVVDGRPRLVMQRLEGTDLLIRAVLRAQRAGTSGPRAASRMGDRKPRGQSPREHSGRATTPSAAFAERAH